METVPIAGPFTWNEGYFLMGEVEARLDGLHCVLQLDPQSDQGFPQPPLANTCHPQPQERKPSGAHGPLEMHARQECSRMNAPSHPGSSQDQPEERLPRGWSGEEALSRCGLRPRGEVPKAPLGAYRALSLPNDLVMPG